MLSPLSSALAWARRGWTIVAWSHDSARLVVAMDEPDDDLDLALLLDFGPSTDEAAIAEYFGLHDGDAQPGVLVGENFVAIIGPTWAVGPWTDTPTLRWSDGDTFVALFAHATGDPLPDISGTGATIVEPGGMVALPGCRLTPNSEQPYEWVDESPVAPLSACQFA